MFYITSGLTQSDTGALLKNSIELLNLETYKHYPSITITPSDFLGFMPRLITRLFVKPLIVIN